MPEEPNKLQKQIIIENLYRHVEYLSVKIGDRHLWKEGSLDRSADYIESAFTSYGYSPQRQIFSCYGRSVSNVIAEKNGTGKEVVVIGAHYDTMPGTPGADDNASAVAGLLELARLLREGSNQKTFLFAAFANEEPPFFGFPHMGSMVYAKHLRERGISVEVMVSLEMLGYFKREPIQMYPLPGMDIFYPKTADYIGIVGNFHSFRYITFFKKGIKNHSSINARSLIAPEFFGGINFSDNFSFWRHGFRALMVTDTAFYRNRHYHQQTDTIDTLNFEQMGEVVKGLYYTLMAL